MYFLTHRHVLLCVTACAKNKYCSSFSSSDKFLKFDMINSKIPIKGKAKCFFNNNSLLHAPSKIRLSVWVSLFRSWINLRIKLFLKTRKSLCCLEDAALSAHVFYVGRIYKVQEESYLLYKGGPKNMLVARFLCSEATHYSPKGWNLSRLFSGFSDSVAPMGTAHGW